MFNNKYCFFNDLSSSALSTSLLCTLFTVVITLLLSGGTLSRAEVERSTSHSLAFELPSDEETVMVAAVIPTYSTIENGEVRPYIVKGENSAKNRDYWQIPIPGDEYSPDQLLDQFRFKLNRAVGPPPWMDDIEDHPKDGHFYYRLPAKLIVSASDGVSPSDLPENVQVETTDNSEKIIDIKGLPSNIQREGIYEFTVVMTDNGAGQSVALNHIGRLQITAEVPETSIFKEEVVSDGGPQGSEVNARQSIPFGTYFTPSQKLASALKEGAEQLKLLSSAAKIAYQAPITSVRTGASLFSVLVKKTASKSGKKIGSAIVKKAYKNGKEIIIGDNDISLSEANYIDGSIVFGEPSGSGSDANETWGGLYFLLRDSSRDGPDHGEGPGGRVPIDSVDNVNTYSTGSGTGRRYSIPNPPPDYLNKSCLRGENFGFSPPDPRLIVHKYDTNDDCRIDGKELQEATSDWVQNDDFVNEKLNLVKDAHDWSERNSGTND